MGVRARRRAGLRGAGAVIAAFVLTGCGPSGSPAQARAESTFISEVHESDPLIGSRRTDVQLVRLGQAACDGFRSGASYGVVADRLTVNQGLHALPSEDLGAVMTAALSALCPQYRGRLS